MMFISSFFLLFHFCLLSKTKTIIKYENAQTVIQQLSFLYIYGGRRDRMAIRFTITCAICAYHQCSCEFEPRSWRGVLDTKLYVIKFVSDLRQVGGFLRVLWFPPPMKLTHHDKTEILLKVALNTINQIKPNLYVND